MLRAAGPFPTIPSGRSSFPLSRSKACSRDSPVNASPLYQLRDFLPGWTLVPNHRVVALFVDVVFEGYVPGSFLFLSAVAVFLRHQVCRFPIVRFPRSPPRSISPARRRRPGVIAIPGDRRNDAIAIVSISSVVSSVVAMVIYTASLRCYVCQMNKVLAEKFPYVGITIAILVTASPTLFCI